MGDGAVKLNISTQRCSPEVLAGFEHTIFSADTSGALPHKMNEDILHKMYEERPR